LEKAFLRHINDHQGIIVKVCRMYGSDPADSEDLFQEIVLQLWKSYPGFNGLSKVSTWMYRVALNTAITRLRKIKRRPDQHRMTKALDNTPVIDPKRLDVEYASQLQRAIDSLNKFDRALVILYLDEMSYREMAEIMGISESNIGVKINRIKNKLKTMLNP
jgi:RNA polymerase sigma-70 factor (ECF subfamily)